MKLNLRMFLYAFLFFSIQNVSIAHNDVMESIQVKPMEYVLDLTVDYEKGIISGICRLTVESISAEETDHIPLLLYRLMRVTSVTDGDGNKLPFEQSVETFPDWDKMQANAITVKLNESLPPYGNKTIIIEYSGYLFGYAETGMIYVKDSVEEKFTIIRKDSFAYPSVGYPMWQALRSAGLAFYDYEISVTVPSRFTVANGGEFISKTIHDGTVTYSYRNIKPAWRMDIAIAEYEVLDKNGLRIFYFPEDEQGAVRVMTEMEHTIDLFTDWFGPIHEYGGFTVIQVPETYGSQADVTSIIQTADAFRDERNIVELYHELSHLWNAPDNDEFPPRWNEGLAMFLQFLVLEKRKNQDGILDANTEHRRRIYRSQYKNSPKAHSTPMIDYGKERLTNLSYTKGMLFFYVYYKLVGEEEFLNTIGNYYQTYVQTGATTEVFLECIKNSASTDISRFVNEWFYTVEIDEKILEDTPLQDLVDMYR